jgi:hypothetical protein
MTKGTKKDMDELACFARSHFIEVVSSCSAVKKLRLLVPFDHAGILLAIFFQLTA